MDASDVFARQVLYKLFHKASAPALALPVGVAINVEMSREFAKLVGETLVTGNGFFYLIKSPSTILTSCEVTTDFARFIKGQIDILGFMIKVILGPTSPEEVSLIGRGKLFAAGGEIKNFFKLRKRQAFVLRRKFRPAQYAIL